MQARAEFPEMNKVSQESAPIAIHKIAVTLRAASKPGAIKAHADVRVEFANSAFEIFGLSVVQHDPQKPPWVSYPQRAGKNTDKFFPIVRVFGVLREAICAAVLSEFEQMSAAAGERMSKPGPGPERARIPDEPGDGDIPF